MAIESKFAWLEPKQRISDDCTTCSLSPYGAAPVLGMTMGMGKQDSLPVKCLKCPFTKPQEEKKE